MRNLRRMVREEASDMLLMTIFVIGAMLVPALESCAQDSSRAAPPPPAKIPPAPKSTSSQLQPSLPPSSPPPGPYQLKPFDVLPGQTNSNTAPAGQAGDAAAPLFSPQASASTAAVSQKAFSPNMIGDGFGSQPFTVSLKNAAGKIHVTSPGAGGTVGTSKIAENTSPIPRDRVYLNYSDFNGVPLVANGTDVSRITPGIEKTFFDGMSSIEVRTPFASTLSSNLNVFGSNDLSSTQFGNLTVYAKQILYRSDTLALSGGLGFALPTASNTNVYLSPTNQLLSIKNQSVHLLPFLGTVYTPTDQFFVQHFLQFDFDTNGDSVSANNFAGGMSPVGRLNDMTYLYYSVGAGYWMYNNPSSDRFFTRIGPVVELHYNKSITSTDTVSNNVISVGTPGINQDLLNGTVGMTAVMGQNATLTVAYCTPLSGIDQRQFNGEFRLMFNWFYGRALNRLTRVQF